MLNDVREPLQRLPDPMLLVDASGHALEANHAFYELVERIGVTPSLHELFGDPLAALLIQAARDGHAHGCLPLEVGPEPRSHFRISLANGATPSRMVALLVDVSEEMKWRKQLFDSHRDLTVLNDLGTALSGTIELEPLVVRIYEQTTRIMRAENFYIALYDRDSDTISFPIVVEGGVRHQVPSRRFTNGMTEYTIRTRQPLLVNRDVLERMHALGVEPIGRPCCSWLGVPMLADGQALGVIGLQDFNRPDVYDLHDLKLLTIIAGQAAAAIKNARLLAAARRAYQELSEAQARLLETERLRGVTETVGAMNHEVNNPLAAIAGNAQLLLRHAHSLAPEVRVKVETMLEAARRIERVTTKMSSIIQATSMPYPGQSEILDVHRSVSRHDLTRDAVVDPSKADSAAA